MPNIHPTRRQAKKMPTTVTPVGRKVRKLDRAAAAVSASTGIPTRPTSNVSAARKEVSRLGKVSKTLARVQKAYATAGGVSGPNISPGESKFYTKLAKATGLSPRVLAAQGTQEGGADDDYNILNIGHTDSGDMGLTADPRWQKPGPAAKTTAKFLKGKEFGASQGIRDILKSAGKPESKQVEAIAKSGWATDPNYFQGISNALPNIQTRQGTKVKPKDLKVLKKAGVAVPAKNTPKPQDNTQPFAGAAAKSAKNPAKIINPKWDPDSDGHGETFMAKAISPVVKKWSNKYDVLVGEAKADSGHVSPGHLQTGTATDLYPKSNTEKGWDELEKGIAVLAKMGFEVGYDGSVPGTQNWSNHGRGNHAHVEWVGQGTSDDAIKKLGGLTQSQIDKIASGSGSGVSVGSSGSSSSSTGGTSSSSSSSSSSTQPSSKKDKAAQRKAAIARINAAYATSIGAAHPLTRASLGRSKAPVV